MKITTTIKEVILDTVLIINTGDNDIYVSRDIQGAGARIIASSEQMKLGRGVYYMFTQSGTSTLSWIALDYNGVESAPTSADRGATSYTQLTDLPQIDSVTVIGNKSIAEYGVDSMTDSEIDDAWGRA